MIQSMEDLLKLGDTLKKNPDLVAEKSFTRIDDPGIAVGAFKSQIEEYSNFEVTDAVIFATANDFVSDHGKEELLKARGSTLAFDPITITTVGALLLLLQTEVIFEKNKTGDWTFKLKKSGMASASILKLVALIHKLISSS
jgi:hypothetical protein